MSPDDGPLDVASLAQGLSSLMPRLDRRLDWRQAVGATHRAPDPEHRLARRVAADASPRCRPLRRTLVALVAGRDGC